MSRGINKVILIGNLGTDPKISNFGESNNYRCTFSLATGYVYRDKSSNQIKQETEWHNIVFFNKLAEIIMQFCKKGSKVYIEGYLKTTKWVDLNNIERKKTEIIGNNIQMLDSKNKIDINMNEDEEFDVKKNDFHDSKNIIDDIPF